MYIESFRVSTDSSPRDLAQFSFYEYLNSPMGYSLYQILSLDLLPGQDDWENHKQWWDGNLEKLRNKLNKRGAFDEYHEFVTWRSQLFMNKYWDLVAKVSIYPLKEFFMVKRYLFAVEVSRNSWYYRC